LVPTFREDPILSIRLRAHRRKGFSAGHRAGEAGVSIRKIRHQQFDYLPELPCTWSARGSQLALLFTRQHDCQRNSQFLAPMQPEV
jgi:hypothetical protein